MLRQFAVALVCILSAAVTATSASEQSPWDAYLVRAQAATGELTAERQRVLRPLAEFIATRLAAGKSADVMAICTANSRRSQLTQAWIAVAAAHHGLRGVRAYSAGTEVTACNERTVAALERCGLSVTLREASANPVYELAIPGDDAKKPLRMWSKLIDDDANPHADFAAVMCCGAADKACPTVPGAVLRVPLLYDDPKVSDGTAEETARYDERCLQIASEMLWVMETAKSQLAAQASR